MSCDCPYMLHSDECKAANPRPKATDKRWANHPDAIADIYSTKQWCTIHGSGFYGNCEVCLQLDLVKSVQDLVKLLTPKKPTRTR